MVTDEGTEFIEGLAVEAVEVSEIDVVECLQVVLLYRHDARARSSGVTGARRCRLNFDEIAPAII